jgi:hypothetical protein
MSVRLANIFVSNIIVIGFLSGCSSSSDSESQEDVSSPCVEWVKKNHSDLDQFEILEIKSMKREDAKLVIEDEELDRNTKILVDLEWKAKDLKGYTTCYCNDAGELVREPYTFYMD